MEVEVDDASVVATDDTGAAGLLYEEALDAL